MDNLYEDDVTAWAQQQVALLRSGQWELLDVEHIAEEIEDMNISHRHALASRMAVLMSHLLKWQYQPERRGASWESTIRTQRKKIQRLLKQMPGLRRLFAEGEWAQDVWDDAVVLAVHEADLHDLPTARPWTFEQLLSDEFFPEVKEAP
jgi:hypothetical protein